MFKMLKCAKSSAKVHLGPHPDFASSGRAVSSATDFSEPLGQSKCMRVRRDLCSIIRSSSWELGCYRLQAVKKAESCGFSENFQLLKESSAHPEMHSHNSSSQFPLSFLIPSKPRGETQRSICFGIAFCMWGKRRTCNFEDPLIKRWSFLEVLTRALICHPHIPDKLVESTGDVESFQAGPEEKGDTYL